MSATLESRRSWEDRLLAEYLEASDALRLARDRVRHLQEIARDCSGSSDGTLALAQAIAINTSARDRCRNALQAFNNLVVDGKLPEDR